MQTTVNFRTLRILGAAWLSKGAAWLSKGAAWLRQQRVGLLYGRPELESRLGTSEEAPYRAEAMKRSRAELDEYYI
jgi:hypothetical protein